MKRCRALCVIALLCSQIFTDDGAKASDLWVSISGFPSSTGVARVSLYNAGKGFPDDPACAFRTAAATIADGSAKVTFSRIPEGLYALSAYHDENENHVLDKRLGGMPAEAAGASRYDSLPRGKPVFAKASFLVYTPVCRISFALFHTGR